MITILQEPLTEFTATIDVSGVILPGNVAVLPCGEIILWAAFAMPLEGSQAAFDGNPGMFPAANVSQEPTSA